MSPRIVVVGGTGAFGGRLVEGLVATTQATTVIAGRNTTACERLAAEMRARHPGRAVETAQLDRANAGAAEIAALDPVIVIDAAGPYQGADLSFARAVIAAGSHYLDIADARDFVSAFQGLDAEARSAGVVAITGASSTPALSHAALDALTAGWRSVESVEIAISPGNRAPRGLSVVAAILSYAGAPVRVLREGRWTHAPGWGFTVRRRLPGLGRRFLSLCETPDLDLVPARWPETRAALFRAGLELPILHLGLLGLSFLRRLGLVRDLARYAGPVRRLADLFERFGSDRGGMTVEARGLDASGAGARAVWSLVAEAGDGPNIPALPALGLARAILAGRPPSPPGARSAAGLLTLTDFDREAARFAISTRIARASPDAASVFERALGSEVERLPAVVRAVHGAEPLVALSGVVDVEGAETAAGKLVARLFGFPGALDGAAADVRIERRGASEIWTRRFGGATFLSRVEAGDEPGMLRETFGPFTFDLPIETDDGGFSLGVLGWRAFGVPMPLRFAPTSIARGFVRPDGAYGFDVEIRLAPFGRLVRYRGRLDVPHRQTSISPISR